ncbi:MAG: nucleoside monophosphate kinase [Verrucomicrobiota bacterium]
MSKPKAYCLIGPPASGKGTHGKLLGGLPGFVHFSMGQAFRSRQPTSPAEKQEMQDTFKQTSKGFLATDDLTFRIFEEYFDGLIASKQFNPGSEILILDGIPRRRSQAEWLEAKIEILKVVELVCDRDIILDRIQSRAMKEGRADDTLEVVRTRLEVYEQELDSLVQFYSDGRLGKIHSDQTAPKVLQDILGHLLA